MKKKLLVTLGDSFTEGVGCYDLSVMPEGKKYKGLEREEREYQEERFHRLGWPNRVGKALGYDKVLNLGLGGSSNSFSIKMLVEKVVANPKYSSYEIFVLWMCTEPSRFSFFDGYTITNFSPSSDPKSTALSRAYVETLKLIDLGALNEHVSYVKLAEQVCQNNNFHLAIVSWNNTFSDLLNLYPSRYVLFPNNVSIFNLVKLNYPEDYSPICRHPNESGYEKIAQILIKGIKKHRPEFVAGESKDEIEWQWDGSGVFPEKILKKPLH